MATTYNFWTSQGFIQTSNLTSKAYGTQSGYQSVINFSILHKYPLPDYTYNTTDISYSNSTKLFGFTRGNDTYEMRFHLKNVNDNYNNYRIFLLQLQLYKNGTQTRFDYHGDSDDQIWSDRTLTKPLTHFYICQPTSIRTSYGTNTIYDYNTTTIVDGNSSYTTYNHMGGFSLGFCTENLGLTNTYSNGFTIQNTKRNYNYTIFIQNGFQSSYTNISDYELTVFYFFGGNVKYVGDDDNSTTGGGFGSGDTTSDTNLIPDTEDNTQFETESALLTSSNLFTTHIMSTADVQALTSFLWDTNIITSLERLFKTNPLDVIVDFKRLPITITSTWTKDIYLGTNDTNINTQIVSKQYVTVNCGTLYPQELWGTSLDYSPHTKMMIYLPFIGFKNINVDYFMQQGITVKYIIDVLSGDFVCFLLRTAIDSNQNVIYTFNGNCAIHYPLTGTSYNSMLLSSSTIAKSTSSGFSSGGQVGAVLGAMNGVGNTIGAKPEYNMSDSYNSNMGFCGIMKPYLLIERPQQSLPSGVENYVGFPSNITETLSNLTGFTKVQDINLQVNATEEEKEEIEKLLKGGVIL